MTAYLKSFWNNNSPLQKLADELNDLVPAEGEVKDPHKNKALERFRKASNCYYDLYNNGLCNRAAEFNRVFGIASSNFKLRHNHSFMDRLYVLTEAEMEKIVIAAAAEQIPHRLTVKEN